jgi:hypothetical protein
LDENGVALSRKSFAYSQGIPTTTFNTYASGRRKVGVTCGNRKKSTVLKTANLKITVHRERVERLEENLIGVTVDTNITFTVRSGISIVDRTIIQNATEQPETFIPAETVMASNAPNLNRKRTFTVRRKAAKRSESWYHKPPPQNNTAPLPPSPQAEVIPAKKTQRF